MTKFRVSKEGDPAAAVFELDKAIFTKNERLTGQDLDNGTWWIAWDPKGNPVGFAGAKLIDQGPNYQIAYLIRAGVSPSARGHGLQRRLINCRVNWAKKQGAKAAITYTLYNNHTSSNNLIKSGFHLYYPEVGWVGDEVLYWWKNLNE